MERWCLKSLAEGVFRAEKKRSVISGPIYELRFEMKCD